MGLFPILLFILEACLYEWLTKRRNLTFIKKRILPLTFVMFTVSLFICGAMVNVFSYLKAQSKESDFIQSQYVKPEDTILHFPEQKRNLVYIFLESMESTFADVSAGDMITDCYIPELAALGVKIDGDRLALGMNLFSDQKTITEKNGYEFLTEELQKQSDLMILNCFC